MKRQAPRKCTECGRSLKRADDERVRAGLQRRGKQARTCGRPACVLARRERKMREWWARRPRLLAERPVPEPWRCSECGIDAGTADVKRARLGLPPIRPHNVTCGPRCHRARERRRYIVRHGHAPRRT